MTSVHVTSSMNLWIVHKGFQSSIYATNIRGPSNEPWGIYISNDLIAHSESELPILTLCNLSLRNENSHRAINFERIPYQMRYILQGSNAV